MTNVQTAISILTTAPSAAGSLPTVGPAAEQAFLAALALLPQPASAPSAVTSPTKGSPGTDPKVDATMDEGEESFTQIQQTPSDLILSGMAPEPAVPKETQSVPAGFLLSTLAPQPPFPPVGQAPGAESTTFRQGEPSPLPLAAPKTPPRQMLASPALQDVLSGNPPLAPPILAPDPGPLPDLAAVRSTPLVPQERVANGSGAHVTALVLSEQTSHPAEQRHDASGPPAATEKIKNTYSFQYDDVRPHSSASIPAAAPSPNVPSAPVNTPLLSMPGSPPPVPRKDAAVPVPQPALDYVSDLQPADARVALGPDVLSSRAGPKTSKPAPPRADISQEESVLRAVWVGAAKDDVSSRPLQGHRPPSKDAPQDSATDMTLAVSHSTAKEASPPLPVSSRSETVALPAPALSADADLADTSSAGPTPADRAADETVSAKPHPAPNSPPPLDPLPVLSGPDRVFSAQPVDTATPPGVLAERMSASPRLDSPPTLPPPPPPQMQIAQAISATNEQTTEILLSPEELGQVRIDMRSDGERMVMTVSAERQDTLDLLRRHADQLAAELRAAGQSAVTLSFGRWSGSGFGAAPDGQPQGTPSAPHTDPENLPLPLPTFRPAIPVSGLYLRI